ncbi:Agmatinase [Klebsiella aerogenes]|nr:Agmatinase [Klebsiella aerogenes]
MLAYLAGAADGRSSSADGRRPVYLSFDIDSLDPIWAPGTGTPEVGGLTSIQALEIVRGCRGLNLIGADLVEVSPPYDVSGIPPSWRPTCCTRCSASCRREVRLRKPPWS